MKPILAALAALLVCAQQAGAERNPFPKPAALEPDVAFWTRVYTEVGTSGGLIHDQRDLSIVYDVVSYPKGLSSRARQRWVEKEKRTYRGLLLGLARGKRENLSRKEKRVLALWPAEVSNGTLRAAASRIRFQLGQANKFRAGLIRSGAWEPEIRKTFKEAGLPAGLAALPHVESSYTPHAYSRVGAAGLWQFTRSTGRRFLRVDHVVDERLDPFKSTVAAARLLEQNRLTTGSWPLAITAYNHGAAGMRRAVRKLGTRDITTIVREYRGRTFGFASRNFYVEFLAALDVDTHAKKYFGRLQTETPVAYEVIELPYFTTARALQVALGIDPTVLKEHNSALRPSVWRGSKYLPRGYEVRIPRDQLARPLDQLLEEVPASQRFAAQQRDTFHYVRRGETLSQIAARYGVRMSDLVAINGLRSRHRIRAGQRIRLPDMAGKGRVVTVATPAASVPLPQPADGEYRVRRGDTISRIATRYGLEEVDLIRLNRLRNGNRIFIGQTIQLSTPVGESEKSVAPPAQITVAVPEPAPADPPDVVEEAPADEKIGVAASERDEASDQNTNPPGESAPSLVADPSDYSVSSDGSIEVQAVETLGHYAEWLGVRASRLRALNRMRYGDPVVVGHRLRLDFSRVPTDQFERQRLEFHRETQGEFFERFEIAGTQVHVMRRGDSLWTLSKRKYRVPLWLLRQYNPDLDFEDLQPGTQITIPLLKPHKGDGDAAATQSLESAGLQVQVPVEAHRLGGEGLLDLK